MWHLILITPKSGKEKKGQKANENGEYVRCETVVCDSA
jgi:hypothetical protein